MSDHEALSQAWAEYSQGAPPDPCHHFIMGWRYAEANAASRECNSVWHLSRGAEENPDDGTIVGECSGGQFVVFAPSKIPIYCPGCGGRVKIEQQTTTEE